MPDALTRAGKPANDGVPSLERARADLDAAIAEHRRSCDRAGFVVARELDRLESISRPVLPTDPSPRGAAGGRFHSLLDDLPRSGGSGHSPAQRGNSPGGASAGEAGHG